MELNNTSPDVLLRHLYRLTWLSGITVALTLIIPRDPKNSLIMGLSPARLVMLAGLGLTLTICMALFIGLRKRPQICWRASEYLEGLFKHRWVSQLTLSTAGIILLAGLYLLAETALTTDDQKKQLLLRLVPVILLACGAAWELLHSEFLGKLRYRWQAGILSGGVYLVIAVLAQPLLLSTLDRTAPFSLLVIYTSRLGAALLAIVYFTQTLATPPVERRTWLLFLLLTAVVYMLQWVVYPNKYWPSQPLFALWGPALIVGLALLTRSALGFWNHLPASSRPKAWLIIKIGTSLTLLGLAVPYIRAAVEHARKLNYSPIFTDQAAYMLFARNARLLNFNYTGDHNRMPGYPFLQGLFYTPGMEEATFFWQGKMINIALSIVLLGLLWWIFSRTISWLEASLLTGVIAFSLYIFKAPYFQAEILFYFLLFLLYILLIQMLRNPSVKLAIMTGSIAGLAHLVKASVLPALLLFSGVYLLKEAAGWIRQSRSARAQKQPTVTELQRLATGGLVLMCFLVVIFPYIRAMKAQFGSYFYNVNTTFYIWYDDNFQAIAAEKQYHFAERWPSQLSADEIPSLRNYLRTHSTEQILERAGFGLHEQTYNILSPFSVTAFHLSFLAVLGLAVLADLRSALKNARQDPFAVMFAILFFAGYLATFVWYSPISPERRFTYGLYIPLLFSVMAALRSLAKGAKGTIDQALFKRATLIMMAWILSANIYLVLTERILFDRFGS